MAMVPRQQILCLMCVLLAVIQSVISILAIGDPATSLTFRYVYQSCDPGNGENTGFILYARLESPSAGTPHFWIAGDGTSGDGDAIAGDCA